MAYNDYTTEQRLKKLLRLGREEIAKALKAKGKHTATFTEIAEAAIAAQHRKEANTDFSKANDSNREQEQNLLLNLLWFDAKAEKIGLNNSSYDSLIKSILTLYRRVVTYDGYKGKIKPLLQIVARYGTTKDKAAICTMHFDYSNNEEANHNPVSKKMAEAIRADIWSRSKATQKDFNNSLAAFDIYNETIRDYQYIETRLKYQCTVQAAAYNLRMWEWASDTLEIEQLVQENVEEKLKSTKIKATKEEINSAIGEAINNLWSNLKGTLLFNGSFDEASTRYEKTKKQDIANITNYLSSLKGMVEALQEFTKQHDSLILTPLAIKKDLIDPKEAFTLADVPEKYYKAYYDKAVASKNSDVTDNIDASKVALLPDYDSVQANEKDKKELLEEMSEKYEEYHK